MSRLFNLLVPLVVCAGFIAGCGTDEDRLSEKLEETDKIPAIRDILPADQQLIGLEQVGDPLVVAPERAGDLLGDLAEIHLHYDLKQMALANFMDDLHHNQYTIEITRYPGRDHAYGLYLHLKSPADTVLQVGAEAVRAGNVLRFVKDKYVVEIEGTGPDFEIEKNLMTIAQAAQANIDTDFNLPDASEVFPEMGMIPTTMRYHPDYFTPEPAFSPSYSADYIIGDDTLIVVYMPRTGKKALDTFIENNVESEPQAAQSNYNSRAYTFVDPVFGNVYVFIKDNRLLAIVSDRKVDIPAEFTNALLEAFRP